MTSTLRKSLPPREATMITLEDIWNSPEIEIDRVLTTTSSVVESLLLKKIKLAYICYKDGLLDSESRKYLELPTFKKILLASGDLQYTKQVLRVHHTIGDLFPEGHLLNIIDDFTEDPIVYLLCYEESDQQDFMITLTSDDLIHYHKKITMGDYSNIPGLTTNLYMATGGWCGHQLSVAGTKFLSQDMKISPDTEYSTSGLEIIVGFHLSKPGERGLSIGRYYEEGLIDASKH
jgi:hypothetical protein